jgi:hypothetical protein
LQEKHFAASRDAITSSGGSLSYMHQPFFMVHWTSVKPGKSSTALTISWKRSHLSKKYSMLQTKKRAAQKTPPPSNAGHFSQAGKKAKQPGCRKQTGAKQRVRLEMQ